MVGVTLLSYLHQSVWLTSCAFTQGAHTHGIIEQRREGRTVTPPGPNTPEVEERKKEREIVRVRQMKIHLNIEGDREIKIEGGIKRET